MNILINFIEYRNISFNYAIAQLKFTNMIYILAIIKNKDILKGILYNGKSALNKLFIKLGDYSFGIYLIHILILAIISKLLTLFEINYIIEVTLKCTFTIGCSCIVLSVVKKYSNNKFYKYIS